MSNEKKTSNTTVEYKENNTLCPIVLLDTMKLKFVEYYSSIMTLFNVSFLIKSQFHSFNRIKKTTTSSRSLVSLEKVQMEERKKMRSRKRHVRLDGHF